MSTLILEKTANCEQSVETIYAVEASTLFTLKTSSSVNVIIYLAGTRMGVLNSTNPSYEATSAGEYRIVITGKCALSEVYASAMVSDQSPSSAHITSDVEMDCHQNTQNISVNSRVIIAGAERPLNVRIIEECNPVSVDYEIVCSSTDLRLLALDLTKTPPSLTELDGTPVLDGATAVNCNAEYISSESCFQLVADNTIKLTRLITYPVGEPSEAVSVWFDMTGAIVPPPPPIEIESCGASPALVVADGLTLPSVNAITPLPISPVKSFTVTKDGGTPITINLPSGSITMNSNGSRTWSSSGDNTLLDVNMITITTLDNANADLMWEV